MIRLQDLGNTNYCVIVPRLTFERRTNATMVAQALNELYVPAYVNERNDICVDSFKISLFVSWCKEELTSTGDTSRGQRSSWSMLERIIMGLC